MQLYYGPSSNFAFLQHIHRTLTKGPSRPTGSTDIGTNQGLDYFKQREIFFDTAPRSNLDTAAAKAGTLFLPFDQAQEFLENYLSSIHHLTPFLGPESLRQLLRRLYGQDPSESLTPARTAIMLLTLANGATLTNHSQWVEILYERAKSEAAPLEETVNLEAVQISLLLAHYQTSCGRPNSSYLQLGLACRKAYAAGLHKEVNYSLEESDASEKSEERRVTLWAVVFWERWVSFWLGRPSSVTQNALSTPMPRSRPLTLALGELSNIIAQTAHDVYGDNRLPLSRLWEVTQRVRLELRSFQRRMEPILGFRMDGSMDKGKIDADQVFMMNFIMHTWIITFRPFLMIHLSWKRANAPHTADDDQLSSRSLPVDMWWLPEACQIAVENASRLIHFFAEAADGSNVVRGLVFSAFYLESACYLLFYDSMRDRSRIDAYTVSLEEALSCLSKMIPKGPIPSITSTVQQMLNEIKKAKQLEYSSTAALPTPASQSRRQPLDVALGNYWPSESAPMPPIADLGAAQGSGDAAAEAMMASFVPGESAFESVNGMDLGFDTFAPDLGDYFDFGPMGIPQ